MRRSVLPVVAAMSLSLLLPQQAASADTLPVQPLSGAEISQVGPGTYYSDTKTFRFTESDVPAGLMGRKHSVVTPAEGGLAKPESAPETRPDMGVFGAGWEAEFLGGQLNRKLEQVDGAVVVTDLVVNESFRYELVDSIEYPGGGGVNKYEDASGSKITETTKWDEGQAALTTTISEVIATELSAVAAGDDKFKDANGNPLSNADLAPTYTWQQPAGYTGADTWRVTKTGNNAFGANTATYDAKGRVSTVTTIPNSEGVTDSLAVTYADSTTASGSAFGDFSGLVKEISATNGQTTQTVARYSYDASGKLRTVSDPSESSEPEATYSYDETGRVNDIDSALNGSWELDFPAEGAVPNATFDGPASPSSEAQLQGSAGITDPNATGPIQSEFLQPGGPEAPLSNPGQCYTAYRWMYYATYGCAAWAKHYGWKQPYFKWTPDGTRVVGINNDHCTDSPDQPSGYDFRTACDSHDYGYGLIGNTWTSYSYYLSRYNKDAVDQEFYNMLVNKTCDAYRNKSTCRSRAGTYLWFVRHFGDPHNGA
ncbi:phospholipase A2 [Streptomyces sp. NPDC048337]|uniref:phospholipase A2 n=1 Tax=Streptomyces sp. NPDC048337 TaxID=3365535 RepID=UPI0037159D57